MNLDENLQKAKDNLAECQAELENILKLQAEQVANQKRLIFLAKSNVKAYEKLIEKAKSLEK